MRVRADGLDDFLPLRNRMFAHLQELTLSFYDHYEVGRIISRVIGDVGVMQEFVTWAIVQAVHGRPHRRHPLCDVVAQLTARC
jgi:ABC-type multidrug transport system fused ATPase/permease subunit